MPAKATRNILFVHNNFPAQFRLLSQALLDQDGFRVAAIGEYARGHDKRIRVHGYSIARPDSEAVHPFARRFDIEARRAEQVTYAVGSLKTEGRNPDLIFAHPGWGEAMPLRALLPQAAIMLYCEFFYRPEGADVGFDTEFSQYGADGRTRIGMRNASQLLSLADADAAVSPTQWQKSTYPSEFHPKIEALHDGIDIDALLASPDTSARTLGAFGLGPHSEYITFVARALEPYRGFHILMRALPELLRRRPQAHVILVGAEDESGYGARPSAGTWLSNLRAELGDAIPWNRVHLAGTVPYGDYATILRHSKAHIYLTYPFVLSWSLIEAMALGRVIIGSDTAPVMEAIEDRKTGHIVPFFDHGALAARIIDVLAQPQRHAELGRAAADHARRGYDFRTRSLPRYRRLIQSLIG
jgi:glycosyltransferase involved in cell wall biosynthesis